MKALISDIHGNYEALLAVFDDIDKLLVDEIYFLGDVVGYGPEPEECIDSIQKRSQIRLLGNHDSAMLNTPAGFNYIAAGAIECLKSRMEPGICSMPRKRRRWRFLQTLQQRYIEDGVLFIHASPRDPVNEYIKPTDAQEDPKNIMSIFEHMEQTAFCGHTHVPGIMTAEPRWLSIEDLDYHYKLVGEKIIINVGSVGQPRDRDPRACYLLLDNDEIEWRRIDYNIAATVEKINNIKCLHPRNGERLWEGI